jgi:hypothetical protein
MLIRESAEMASESTQPGRQWEANFDSQGGSFPAPVSDSRGKTERVCGKTPIFRRSWA